MLGGKRRALRLVCSCVIAATLGMLAFEPPAGATGSDAVVSINTKDGRTTFRVRFHIRRANGDVVDSGNAAVAVASCSDCETVAVSFQVLLIDDDASTVTPTNLAIAINQGCDGCETLASAYQDVLSVSDRIRFTHDGRDEINAIRTELQRLRKADLSIEDIQARLDALQDRLLWVLTTQIVTVPPPSEPAARAERPFAAATTPQGEPIAPPPTAEPSTTTAPQSAPSTSASTTVPETMTSPTSTTSTTTTTTP